MITVSVKKLLDAIEEAEEYKLPEMNEGMQYLYDELYGKASRGMELHLSEIKFDSFELEDIDELRDLHFTSLEANESKANTISGSLLCIQPVAAASEFV